MVIIFSTFGDPSTNEVINWISLKNEEVQRVNTIDDLKNFLSSNSPISIHNPENIWTEKISGIWHRRHPKFCERREITGNIQTDNEINYFYESEQKSLFHSFCEILNKKRWLNNYSNSRINKTIQLLNTTKVKLKSPETRIISTKKDLINFYHEKKKIIVKPIQDVFPIHIDGEPYLQYTKIVNMRMIKHLKDTFFPCLFQEYIDKNIEIRSFFLDNQLYSMGICSSFDKQTSIDFRKYNEEE